MTTRSTGHRAATKQATRDALITAAVAELFDHGLTEPSLDSICARAGFTRGAFYVHFRDREELLIAAMDRVLGDLLRSMISAGPPGGGGLAPGIRKFAAAAEQRTPSTHSPMGLRFHQLLEACHTSKPIGDRYRSILAGAAGWARHEIDSHQQRGALVGVDAAAAANVLVATGLGLIAMFELGISVDPIQLGEALIAIWRLDPAPASTSRPRPKRGKRGSRTGK